MEIVVVMVISWALGGLLAATLVENSPRNPRI